jgi:hypothetical protein
MSRVGDFVFVTAGFLRGDERLVMVGYHLISTWKLSPDQGVDWHVDADQPIELEKEIGGLFLGVEFVREISLASYILPKAKTTTSLIEQLHCAVATC